MAFKMKSPLMKLAKKAGDNRLDALGVDDKKKTKRDEAVAEATSALIAPEKTKEQKDKEIAEATKALIPEKKKYDPYKKNK